MTTPFVHVTDLVKTYHTPAGPHPVLQGIDLTLNKGDFATLIGSSGTGKTTLLNMLTAIDRPTEGGVVVGDVNVTRTSQNQLTKWRARHVGIVFQFFQLLPTLNVLQNVVAPMDLANVHPRQERREHAMHWLERLGIADQALKTPDMLSGGQQQRVAIARALANGPAFFVGDELTANLDRMNAQNVFAILWELAQQGTTVIVASYDRDLVKDAPMILDLQDGQIRQAVLAAKEQVEV